MGKQFPLSFLGKGFLFVTLSRLLNMSYFSPYDDPYNNLCLSDRESIFEIPKCGTAHLRTLIVMAKVKAKFKIDRYETSLQKHKKDHSKPWTPDNVQEYEQRTIIMSPVYGTTDPNSENSKFWAATPSGEIKLGVVNQEAWEHLPLGREVYVTFEIVEDEVK